MGLPREGGSGAPPRVSLKSQRIIAGALKTRSEGHGLAMAMLEAQPSPGAQPATGAREHALQSVKALIRRIKRKRGLEAGYGWRQLRVPGRNVGRIGHDGIEGKEARGQRRIPVAREEGDREAQVRGVPLCYGEGVG